MITRQNKILSTLSELWFINKSYYFPPTFHSKINQKIPALYYYNTPKIIDPFLTMHLSLIIPLLASVILNLTSSQSPPTTITYSNCSSVYCLTCTTPYLCSECSANDQPLCCPKYCTKCLNMNVCLQCENHFFLKPVNNAIICSRAYNSTDPNRNQNNMDNCINGFYVESVTSSCMNCNIANCQTCNAYQTCSQCNSNFFPYNTTTINAVNQTVLTLVCQPCIPNCVTCTSITSCTTCQSGYFTTTFSCEPCQKAFCSTCTNNGQTCQTCVKGSFLNSTSGTCGLCSYAIKNCTTCSVTNAVLKCNICATGFFLNSTSNVCTPCPSNCYYCEVETSNVLNCTNCSESYIYDNITNTCILCGTGCDFCDFVNSSLNNCTNCSNGYAQMWNNNTQAFSCVSCQYPCVQCTNDSICIQCETGFFLNYLAAKNFQIGQCYFCNIEQCISCSSQSNCTQCEDGYYVKFSAQTNVYGCSPCPGQCSICSVSNITLNSVPKCEQCASNYTLQKGNCVSCKTKNCMVCNPLNQSECIQCNSGFYPFYNYSMSAYQCVECNLSNCIVCNSTMAANCLQCNVGYYLVLNTQNTSAEFSECAACGPNCFSCLNQSYCSECLETFHVVVEANMSAVCRPCLEQCLTCNQNGCLFCDDGYYPTVQQNVYANQSANVLCNACIANLTGCVSCFNGVFCKQCTPIGYSVMPNPQGSCVSCGFGCIACDNEQVCTNCSAGFLLNTQINQCMDVAGVPAWGFFVIITFGGALIFTLIEKIIRYINRRKQRRLEQLLLEITATQRPFYQMQGTPEDLRQFPNQRRSYGA